MNLDKEIGDAFSLIGLLLVFLFAYFSALWTQVDNLVGRPKRNEETGALRNLRKVLVLKRRHLAALSLLIVLVVLLLAPLSFKVIQRMQWGGTFSTIRAGLLLVALLLVMLLAAVVILNRKAAFDVAFIDGELERRKASPPPPERESQLSWDQFVFPGGKRPWVKERNPRGGD
ncbi:hypothetical protein [Streptomyces purpureus]|uniref:Uncharacterized protein n=1 Tax=Streptomyces purpureus TaxID=1951 RepID=A0A918GZU5_9ACTN|nr:hypothetical protein [Streptomyces purpureus]GGT26601.1 hypothetical protein GCM10014713_19680 [Streptomyces purpureus]